MHLVVIARARCNEAGSGDVDKCEGPSRFRDLFHFQIWRRSLAPESEIAAAEAAHAHHRHDGRSEEDPIPEEGGETIFRKASQGAILK